MSRTVLSLVAVGAVIIAAAVGIAWRVKMNDRAAIAAVQPAPPASAGRTAAASPGKEQAPAPPPPSAPAEPRPAAVPAPAAVMAPSFDVARIGADGRAVIAGRAAPGARIVLIDGGKEIARGEADSRGEWVILAQDPPLAPGQHELRAVQHIEGRAPVTSEQVVIAVVPTDPAGGGKSGTTASATITPPSAANNRDQTLVMISPPSGPATLLQSPSSAGAPRVGDLQLSTLDYDQHGQTTITGQATPRATVRAYVDDKLVAESRAGADGRWKLAPSEPVDAGMHKLRLDRLAEDGRPTARLELAFERLVVASNGTDGRRLHVVRGDNLWNIARAHYGEGWRYTVIFDANKDQIRDPGRIYPGQIFSLPKVN